MPSAKLRGTNPRTGTLEDAARQMLEKMPRPRGDIDVTPERGPEYDITTYSERPAPQAPMNQAVAGEVDAVLQEWIKEQTRKRGQKPPRLDIERYRSKLTERYRNAPPEPPSRRLDPDKFMEMRDVNIRKII